MHPLERTPWAVGQVKGVPAEVIRALEEDGGQAATTEKVGVGATMMEAATKEGRKVVMT